MAVAAPRASSAPVLPALAGLVLATVAVAPGCIVIPLGAGARRPPEPAEVIAAESWFTDETIAVIPIQGVISSDEDRGLFSSSPSTVEQVVERLRLAAEDDDVVAVVLRVDSPGGSVTASDILHEEIRLFRERTGKPVVAHYGDTAASGAVYCTQAASEVIAHPTCVTGSIGVIAQVLDLHGLMDEFHVALHVFKSGPLKDLGSFARAPTDEERAVFQGVIDRLYERFLQVIQQRRPDLALDDLRSVADGRVFLGAQALEHGLVDRLGSIQDAVARARELAHVDDARVVLYVAQGESGATIYSRARPPALDASLSAAAAATSELGGASGVPGAVRALAGLLPELPPGVSSTGRPAFWFLWQPGLGLAR